jgi:hypothetical protein
MSYHVSGTIAAHIDADSPEEAALLFAQGLEQGAVSLSDIADRDEDDETLAEVGVSEETPDGRKITYHVAVGNRRANIRWITEGRPFRFSDEEER